MIPEEFYDRPEELGDDQYGPRCPGERRHLQPY